MLKSILRSIGLITYADHNETVSNLITAHANEKTSISEKLEVRQRAYSDAYLREIAAHESTTKQLRFAGEGQEGLKSQINIMAVKLGELSALPIIERVYVLPNVGPDGGKISRYALAFDCKVNKLPVTITTRSLVASAKNKKELEEDAGNINRLLNI